MELRRVPKLIDLLPQIDLIYRPKLPSTYQIKILAKLKLAEI